MWYSINFYDFKLKINWSIISNIWFWTSVKNYDGGDDGGDGGDDSDDGDDGDDGVGV